MRFFKKIMLCYKQMENLFLIECQSNHIPLLQAFSVPYEYSIVELCSLLKKGPDHFYFISKNSNPQNKDDITGFFFLNKALYFCLPFLLNNEEVYENLLFPLFSNHNFSHFHLILGEQKGCQFFTTLLSKINQNIIPKHTNEYEIMTLTSSPNKAPETLSDDDIIKCCTKQDFDFLFNLQKNYIIKEVALPNQKITDNETGLMLSDILKNQLVMALYCGTEDNEYVSKVNTNAIGYNWVQLGGIFTHPLHRHNYYAWHLINAISTRIQKSGKAVCLFVKDRNIPAKNLYTKIGFEPQGKMNIIYF